MSISLPTATGAQQPIIRQKPVVTERLSLSQSTSDEVHFSHQSMDTGIFAGVQEDANQKKPSFLYRLFGCFSRQPVSDSDAAHPLRSSQKLMTSIIEKKTRKALNQIRKGRIDLEKPGAGGFTPLQLAVQQGNKKVVQALLQAGVNAQRIGPLGKAPIHAAITHSHLEVLKLLLASGKVDVNQTCNMGQTPLHLSLSSNSTECTQLLLQAGCDYNKKDAFNRTAVYEAAQLRKPAHLALLLSANADPNIPDSFGITPLDMAARSFSKGRTTDEQALTVKLLLQHGARVEQGEKPFLGHQSPQDRTIKMLAKLLIAARQQDQPDTELINLLLEHPGVAEQEKAERAAVQEDNSFSSSF